MPLYWQPSPHGSRVIRSTLETIFSNQHFNIQSILLSHQEPLCRRKALHRFEAFQNNRHIFQSKVNNFRIPLHTSIKGVVPHYKYCLISYNTNIISILFSAIIAFLVVMLLHLSVSRKSRNNLELAAKK